jgi:acetylornithine deacetylase/succinyl-diaminopimelate desuccinylase-like protein
LRTDHARSSEIDKFFECSTERFRGWLTRLVGIDSEAPNEAAAQIAIADIARSAGLAADLWNVDPWSLERDERFIPTGMSYADRPNCVVRVPGTAGSPVICNAHIDTVAIGPGWTRNPLGEWDNDRLYGRGTCDTKGSTVAALMAMTCIHTLGLDGSALVLHSVIDEEPGGNGTLAQLRADAATVSTPRLVLVMEPSRLNLFSGHRGMLWYRVRCEGEPGHGSTGAGVNAIEMAAEIVLALRQVAQELSATSPGDVPAPSINTGTIRGGTEAYTTPGSCEFDVTARYSFGQRDLVLQSIARGLADSRLPGRVVEVFCHDFDAAATPDDDPEIERALAIVRRHHSAARGGQLVGTCDMRHYRSVHGCPTAIFGPGDLTNAHCPDEFVDWSDVGLAARILVDIALNPTRSEAA